MLGSGSGVAITSSTPPVKPFTTKFINAASPPKLRAEPCIGVLALDPVATVVISKAYPVLWGTWFKLIAVKLGFAFIAFVRSWPIEFTEPPPVKVNVWVIPSADVSITVFPSYKLLFPPTALGIVIVPTADVPCTAVVGDEIDAGWRLAQSSALKHSITNKPKPLVPVHWDSPKNKGVADGEIDSKEYREISLSVYPFATSVTKSMYSKSSVNNPLFIKVPVPSSFIPFCINILLEQVFLPGITVVVEVELFIPPPPLKSTFVKNSTSGNCCGLPQAGVNVSSNNVPFISVLPSIPCRCWVIIISISKLYFSWAGSYKSSLTKTDAENKGCASIAPAKLWAVSKPLSSCKTNS